MKKRRRHWGSRSGPPSDIGLLAGRGSIAKSPTKNRANLGVGKIIVAWPVWTADFAYSGRNPKCVKENLWMIQSDRCGQSSMRRWRSKKRKREPITWAERAARTPPFEGRSNN